MEILSPTTPSTSHIFPKLSFLSTNISFTTRIRKTQLKFNSKPSVHLPFSPNLAFPGAKRFQISAHFGGPTSRRNSLRKKLTQQKQVSDNPLILLDSNSEIQNQVLDFNAEKLESNRENDRVEIGSSKFEQLSSEIHSESDLSSKLKSWVDQYKADSEFWGIGSGRIFTVFQDSDGKVKRVDVDEEEIIRRSGLEVALYKASELEDLTEVNLKISHAKSLAREMENGNNVLSKTSSVAKFVVSGGELGFMSSIRGGSFPPGLLLRMSRVGIVVLCGLCVFGAVKRLLRGDENKMEYSSLEKEMLRRKMKARMEKDKLVKSSVEVIQASKKIEFPSTQKPLLDRQDLMDNITEAKASNSTLTLQTSSREEAVKSTNFDDKIREINSMARHARELEKKGQGGLDGNDEEDNQSMDKLSSAKEVVQEDRESDFTSLNRHYNEHIGKLKDVGENIVSTTLDDPKTNDTSIYVKTSVENSETTNSTTSEILVSNVGETKASEDMGDGLNLLETTKTSKITDSSATNFNKTDKFSAKSKPKVIRSVKEAREYLSKKGDRKEQRKDLPSQNFSEDNLVSQNRKVEETSQRLVGDHNECNVSIFTSPDLINEKSASSEHACESIPLKNVDHESADELYVANNHHIIEASSSTEDSTEKEPSSINFPVDRDLGRQRSQETQINDTWPQSSDDAKSDSASSQSACESNLNAEGTIPIESNNAEDIVKEYKHQMPASYSNPAVTDSSDVVAPAATKDNWMESNFHEFEPVAKKIAAGFKDNYMVSRQKKINQELNFDSETGVPEYDGDGELDWMKDDRLREIVFQVRENELMGRDPFHLMDAEDKKAFFDGLEKKVEKVNENLQNLHQWVHSNIENLDYGADGISVNDPLEKIIPRWKGPPIDTSPQSLDDYMKQRQVLINENLRSQIFKNQKAESPLQTSVESSPSQNGVNTSVVDNQNKNNQNGLLKPPKIVIEGSDGSVRAGKKSGKEYWEHTKKWTRGFLEVYNAETDPEIKATMKDMGKDLKRWITEKEIKESADMMDKLPERGRKLIQEKLYKVKKEMELYGPQAVVNKYSEYTEEKEEDYLWWLDLPFVLCIELYTNQDDQNIGYYSLEMASDLELNPKQYHVIAFEDAGDCKNMCYIIQSHLEMLGNGNAFVVAQPPKDAFREAKANGFNVTVIRKGELKLNVDQNLEEVEEQITEIGSKMYHDKITKGRSVDISSIAKGVFGIKNKTMKKRKRSRKKLKKPTNY